MIPILKQLKLARLSSFKTSSVLILILFLTAILTYVRVNSGSGFAGDTGQFYMILENIHAGSGPYNQILPSELQYFFRQNITTLDASKLCDMSLVSPEFNVKDFNHFKYHVYAILYPASLLLYLFSAPFVANGLNILSFLLFIFVTFKIARREEIPTYFALFLTIVVSFHPAWSWSIMGQPYVDRLFLPLGLLLCLYASDKRKSYYLLLPIAIISALIVEKVPIYTGGFLIAYSILFYKDFSGKHEFFVKFTIGATSIFYAYLIVKFWLDNQYFSNTIPHTFNELLNAINNTWADQRLFNGAKSLILVNAPFLLPALLFAPRLFLIAIVLLIPNILTTIGGAEKTGYLTHYHTLYFPFVVYAFIIGFSKIFRSMPRIKATYASALYLFFSAMFYFFLGFESNQNIHLTNTPNVPLYTSNFSAISNDLTMYKRTIELVNSNIPLNAKISTIEAGWPYLYKFHNLSIYPFDITNSEFLFVSYRKVLDQFYYSGFEGYLGSDNNKMINDCLNERIRKADFDTDSPVIVNATLAILRKKID